MSNESNCSILLLLSCRFLNCFCLIFVLLFILFGFVSFVTTTLENFQFQSQVGLSQNNIVLSIRLKIKLYTIFIEWWSRVNFLSDSWTIRHRQQLMLSLQDFRKLPQKFGFENCSIWLIRNVCTNVSLRSTGLCCSFCSNDLACSPFHATTTQLSSQSLFSTLFAAALRVFLPLTTSAVSGASNSKKSAPTRFVTTQKWKGVPQKLVQVHGIPVHVIHQ